MCVLVRFLFLNRQQFFKKMKLALVSILLLAIISCKAIPLELNNEEIVEASAPVSAVEDTDNAEDLSTAETAFIGIGYGLGGWGHGYGGYRGGYGGWGRGYGGWGHGYGGWGRGYGGYGKRWGHRYYY